MKSIKLVVLTLIVILGIATPCRGEQNEKVEKSVKGALLHFAEKEYDFGEIDRKGENKQCHFHFENRGSEPLVVLSAMTSCSCLKTTFSRKPVAPGGKGTITLHLEARKVEEGVFHRVIQIHSNSSMGTEMLTIKGSSK